MDRGTIRAAWTNFPRATDPRGAIRCSEPGGKNTMPTPEKQNALEDRSALELAQWSEWKATRRRLLKAGLFTSSAMAFAGLGATRYLAPLASA